MSKIKFKIAASSSFKSDIKKLNAKEKNEVKFVIDKIANGEQLEEKYRDHQLTGKLKSFRDCHVKNDLVLIYRIMNDILELYLYRIGSHSDLFGK